VLDLEEGRLAHQGNWGADSGGEARRIEDWSAGRRSRNGGRRAAPHG
jgi:hypothetical protein